MKNSLLRNATIRSGGTTKVASPYLRVVQTLTINITKSTSSTLLFFYLINSGDDIVGFKTPETDEDLFVKPTGTTQMAPLKTNTWGAFIKNDNDVSTSITYSLRYLKYRTAWLCHSNIAKEKLRPNRDAAFPMLV